MNLVLSPAELSRHIEMRTVLALHTDSNKCEFDCQYQYVYGVKMHLKKVVEYLYLFMEKHNLFPLSRRAFIAVSGGRDSMCLLFLLQQMLQQMKLSQSQFKNEAERKIESLTILFVNHGTRGMDNIKEEKLVIDFAKKLNVGIEVIRLEKDFFAKSNFEFQARSVRYQFFNSFLRSGDLIYTAHHIDDSFEWYLLNLFKTAKGHQVYGIPVLNKNVARPFMAFTREQIDRLVKKFKIPYCDDSSNLLENYERNYLRLKVIPNIKKRFPSYLKNYVTRVNRLVLNDLPKDSKSKTVFLHIDRYKGTTLVDLTYKNSFERNINQIVEIIESKSKSSRGKLRDQVNKLIEAVKNGKKGPMSFSGGVLGFIEFSALYFIHQDDLSVLNSDLRLNYSKIFLEQEKLINSTSPLNSGDYFLFYLFLPKHSANIYRQFLLKRKNSLLGSLPEEISMDIIPISRNKIFMERLTL